MKPRSTLLAALALLLVAAPLVQAAAPVRYRYTLTYVFENRGVEELELEKEDLAVPYFMDTEWQGVEVEDSTRPLGETIADGDGNRFAVVDVPGTLGPGETVSFTVTYLIESSEKPRPDLDASRAGGYEAIPVDLVGQYTGSSETFMSDDPGVSSLAYEIAGDEPTVLGAVTAMMEWLGANTEYCNFEVPRYPNTTIAEGLGDCDDQSILLISMCRSLGIPAYLQVGIIIHPSLKSSDTSWEGHLTNTQDGVGWHGWAMIYVPPWGWVPVDLTLVQEDDGLQAIMGAPEYGTNLIPCFEVSRQEYIGDTMRTRSRIIQSSLYIEITDSAERVYTSVLGKEVYLVAGLGLAVTVAIVFMFLSVRKAQAA